MTEQKQRTPQINIRVSAPSHKGLNNILNTLEQEYIFSRKTLPRFYRHKETGEVTYTVYVSIQRFRR